MQTVIISGKSHPCLQAALVAKGYQVMNEPNISYAALTTAIADAVGLVVTTRLKIDAALIDAAPQLQWIGRLGSGMEMIDVAYATSKGIKCISSPEGNRNAVAEHTLALILNLMNHISRSFFDLKQFRWTREQSSGEELEGKTVGIIGFGHTGSSVAKLLAPFGVRVLAYDKYQQGFGNDYVVESSLATIAAEADVISLHVPLTEETYHLANATFFQALQKQPYFINTCRGKVVDTTALVHALQQAQIKAAGLDVLENEQLDTYTSVEKERLLWLAEQKNVVLTPHIAGVTKDSFYKMSKVLCDKLGL